MLKIAQCFPCLMMQPNILCAVSLELMSVISKPALPPFVFYFGDMVNKLPTCGVMVILNPTVSDGHGFYAAVFGKVKLFAVLGFLI